MQNFPLLAAAGLAALLLVSMASLLWWRGRRPHPAENGFSPEADLPDCRPGQKGDFDGPETQDISLPAPPQREAPLFTAVEVVKSYDDASGERVTALRLEGRPLEIGPGVTAILGPSGVGKSTLLSLFGGLDVPSDGVLRYRGEPLPDGESAALQAHRAHHVALVFQSLNLITHLSALENAALPLLVRGVGRGEALDRARRNLALVGIGEELLARLPAQLSGGQQQRVAVARAFAADAEVILADEPTGSLDPETAESVMEVFAGLARETGRPVVLVTHNEDLAGRFADRVVRLTAHGYEEVAPPRPPGRLPVPRGDTGGRPRMGWLNRLRYAFSDLRHRRTSTAVTVLAVGIAALYALLVGFSGERVHHLNREALGRVLVTRVVAQSPQVTDAAHRFTPQRLAELAGWPEVRLAFPCIEFNAEAALGAGKAEMLPLAATVPGDPALAADRLEWGAGVHARDANEVVISRRLFERLGGKLTPGPLPAEMDVQVGRQMAGRGEVQRVRARIAGLLRSSQEEKVFLPLETAARLNLWREGKLADLGGGRGRASQVEYPFCLAYSPPARADRVREELEHYTLRGEKVRTVEVTETAGPVWADVVGAGVPEAAREPLRKLANVRTSRGLAATVGGRTALALAPEDSRWGLLPRDAAMLGRVGTRPGVPVPTLAEGYRLPESFPAKGDLVCTPETLGWLLFEPRSPRAERFTLVRTRSLEAGAALAAETPGKGRADLEEGWLFLRPKGDGGLPRELTTLRLAGAADAAAVAEGSVKVRAASDSGTLRSIPVRVLPDALFARIVTRRPRRGRIACAYVSLREEGAPSTLDVRGLRLEICEARTGPVESLWISSSDAADVCPDARPAAAAVWGRWESLLRARHAALGAGWSIDAPASRLPGRFTALVPGRADGWRRRLALALKDAVEVCGVPDVGEVDGGRRLVAVAAADLGDEGEGVRVGGEPAGRRSLTLRVAETTWDRIQVMGDPELPPGLLVVGERLFRELAFRAAGSPLPPAVAHETLSCDDPLAYAAAERLLAAQGTALVPLTAVRRRTLVEYRVRDGRAAEGKVKPEVVQLLRALPPAFEAAQGQVAADALLAGGRVSCTGSDAADPRRFGLRLSAGAWLPREGGRQAVLPAGLAARCGTSAGGEVLLRFPRGEGGRSESVALPVKVAGVTEDGDGVQLPGRLVEEVLLWKAGLLEFNEASLEFESPVESSLRQGHVRCNLYAAGPEEVAPLVRRLQAQGYHTEDRLAEQEGVRELGRVLVAVVVFFVSGCVLISAITVWLTTTLNLQSKTWEIGILRSLGVPARDVLGIFLVQGLLMGLTAFLGALAVFAAVQAHFREKAAQVLAIKESAFLEGGPFEPSVLWLPALVALVAVGFSVLGVMVPSLHACRLMPAEALRRRE